MTEAPTSTTAQDALHALVNLPPLAEMGLSLIAIAPDATGELGGFDVPLTGGAQEDIGVVAGTTRAAVQDAALLAYGPAVEIPRQHWMHVGADEAALVTSVEALVKKHDLLPFDSKSDTIGAVKLLAARFTSADQQTVTFYRIADSLLQLKRARISLIYSGGQYGRLEPAEVLVINTDFDVVVINGHAFFRKKTSFEQAFGFLDKLKSESLATFKSVTSNLNIGGFDALQAACTSQSQMMAKMSSIRRSMDADPAYAEAMTMPKLVAYIRSHPHVQVDLASVDGVEQLVFDPTPAKRFQILKLLDDDFLHSVLTDRDYEAGSKVQTAT